MKEEEYKRYYYEDDEIDLHELWLILKKRWKVVFITMFFFTLFAGIYAFTTPPVYLIKHTYVVSDTQNPNYLTGQINAAINNLSDYLKYRNLKILSNRLSIPVPSLKDIKKISFLKGRKATTVFSISIEGTKREELKVIDKALRNYIYNLPPIKGYISIKRESLTKTLDIYESNLSKLKSLASSIVKNLKNNNLKILGFNPLDVEDRILYYESKINEIQIQLKNLKPIKELSTFFPEKPVKPKKALIISVALISGLFLGLFLAFFAEWVASVKEKHKEEG